MSQFYNDKWSFVIKFCGTSTVGDDEGATPPRGAGARLCFFTGDSQTVPNECRGRKAAMCRSSPLLLMDGMDGWLGGGGGRRRRGGSCQACSLCEAPLAAEQIEG